MTPSRSEQAARWLSTQTGNVALAVAGKRFGITREAVRQAWHRLGLGETPREKCWQQIRSAIVDLARTGKQASQIAELMGVSNSTISHVCHKAGVSLKDSRCGTTDPDAIAAGLEAVRAGGTIGEGSCIAGLQYAAFYRYVQEAKIAAVPFDQRKRKLGRSAQAAQLVEHEGASAGEAARVFGIAPNSVRDYLRRHAP